MKSRDRDHSAIGLKHLKIRLLEGGNVKNVLRRKAGKYSGPGAANLNMEVVYARNEQCTH